MRRRAELERADHERDQVRRHDHGLVEAHPPAAVAGGLLAVDGRVGQRGQILIHDQRDPEHRLELGLVPAGEGPAGVRGLELGDGDDVIDPVVGREGAAVEAVQVVVEDAGEAEVQPVARAGGQQGVEFDRRPLRRLVELDPPLEDGPVRCLEASGLDGQLGGVADQRSDRLDHLEGDDLLAVEARRGQIGRQLQLVVTRPHAAW